MKDILGVTHYIRAYLVKNLFSINNPLLYQYCTYGTKNLINQFQHEIIKSLDFIANYKESNYPLYKKLEFFSEVRHCFGRSALMLSGGASLGIYHIGVVKALYEQGLLPKIICGSSAGSIMASVLGTTRYEDIPGVRTQ